MQEPSTTAVRGSLAFEWAEGVLVRSTGTYRDKQGIHTDLKIAVKVEGKFEYVTSGMLNLKSVTTRTQWQRRLTELQPVYQWYEVLEYVSTKVEKQLLEGRPAVWLDEVKYGPLVPRLEPLLYKRQATIFFGDGGSGKSTLALGIAVAIATGGMFLGEQAEQCPVLYLDWEADDETMARRLAFIKRAQEHHEHIPVLYKRVYGLLRDQIDAIAALCVEHGIGVIVVDALAKAIADAPEGASAALSFFDAIDSLERDSLIIDHIDKAKATPGKPYGSVFKYNSARSVWFANSVGEPDAGEIYLKLEQSKANDTAKHKPIPVHIVFQEGQTIIERTDWSKMPTEMKPESMTQWDAVRGAMDYLHGKPAEDIAKAVELEVKQVQKALDKNKAQWSKYTEAGRAYYRLISFRKE